MANLRDKHAVLCEGSEALKELVENYATMDVEAFCAKWGLAISTVRSTASRRGLRRFRGKEAKSAPPTRIGALSTPRRLSPNPKPCSYQLTNRQRI